MVTQAPLAGLFLLLPDLGVAPYRDGDTLPLGAALLADPAFGIETLVAVGDVVARAPWLGAVCIARPLELTDALVTAVHRLPEGTAVLRIVGDAFPDLDEVRAALANETVGPDRFAAYVERRLPRSPLADLVHQALTAPEGDDLHPRTVQRRLRALGPLSPSDWRRLLELAVALQLSNRRGAGRPPLPADPRTLSSRASRFADLTFAAAQRQLGWRWAVETALRNNGYLRTGTPAEASGA